MEIHILTQFHLKMKMIGDDIAKKVFFPQKFDSYLALLWPKFCPKLPTLKESVTVMI